MIASVHVADVGARRAISLKRPDPGSVPGLRWAKTALAAPFRGKIRPPASLGRAGLIALWDGDDALDAFLADHPTAARLAGGWHVRLDPLRAFGTWPGLPEDIPAARQVEQGGPAAVLTLGRLRMTRTISFLRTSAKAEADLLVAPGLTWATAMARPPFVATCSLWESSEALSAYAYGDADGGHPAAITAHRSKPFHHESVFVRFRPYASSGHLDGKNPLAESWLANA